MLATIFCFVFYLGSFSYTSHAVLGCFFRGGGGGGVLTYPKLTLFFCGEFLLHIPCCFVGFFLINFLIWGVSLTNPMLATFFFFFFFKYFIWGVSLTHPMLF